MATGQTLLDTMEVVFPELQLQSGEADVTRGLIALNRAQDMFETHVAQYKDIFGGTVGSVVTTSGVENTAFPTTLLRLDGLDFIDPATSRPQYPLDPLDDRPIYQRNGWVWDTFGVVSGTGKPYAYWTDGSYIYWDPIPDGAHTIRWHGLVSASDITAGGTFAYKDYVILPIATIAAHIIKIGLDDAGDQLNLLATTTFNSVLDVMGGFQRDGGRGYRYSRHHTA